MVRGGAARWQQQPGEQPKCTQDFCLHLIQKMKCIIVNIDKSTFFKMVMVYFNVLQVVKHMLSLALPCCCPIHVMSIYKVCYIATNIVYIIIILYIFPSRGILYYIVRWLFSLGSK